MSSSMRRDFLKGLSVGSLLALPAIDAAATETFQKMADQGGNTVPAASGSLTQQHGTKMNYGDYVGDAELKKEWEAFCEKLRQAGALVFKNTNPATALQRVDGFRYLTQNLSQAFDLALETKDTRFPAIEAFCSPTRKLGGDNADCVYLQAWIDGQSVYKITGRKGTARFWNITVQGPRPEKDTYYGTNERNLHEPFGDTPEATMFGHDLKTEWDGSFVLYVGGPKRGPNWLPTTPGSRKLYMRQYFDRWDEESAEYRIERVDMDGPRPIPTPHQMIEAMRWAGQFVYDVVDYWPEWSLPHINSTPNQFPATESKVAGAPEARDKLRGRFFSGMRWKLAQDEALIIEFDNSDAFWMLTNMGVFWNSMDFAYRNVSYTPSRTSVDVDGKIRLVMSHADPGLHNWIDTQGYIEGYLAYRNVLTREYPPIKTRTIKFSQLSNALPHAKRVTIDERKEQLLQRYHAIQRRYRI